MGEPCAECGMMIGKGTPHSALQHTIACMHLPAQDRGTLSNIARKHGNEEYGKRVLQNLEIEE